jgi:DNA-directed RNA polymerase subunit K/omega
MQNMTKYECSYVMGIRAKQLNDGAPILVAAPQSKLRENFLYLAAKELQEGKLTLSLRRPMPGGGYYDVDAAGLALPDDLAVFIDMCEQQ